MLLPLLFLSLVFHALSLAARVPARGAITHGSASASNGSVSASNATASTSNATASISNATVGYPPAGQPFHPSAPNPLTLVYHDRVPPATHYEILVPWIESCVLHVGLPKIEELISWYGEGCRVRRWSKEDGDFACDTGAGLMLNIRFFPELAEEPTYGEVEWGLLAILEAADDKGGGYHEEASIFATEGERAVTRVEMYLSEIKKEAVAVTK